MYGKYFLGQTTTATTDFVPNASIYTGTSGSTFQNANEYYILYNDGLAFSTTTGTDLTINNDYLIYYYYGRRTYYLNKNNGATWRLSNSTTRPAIAYTVTTSTNINDFTVSGDATITTTGTNSSYTHTDAEYFYVYTFNDLTYYSTDPSTAASTSTPDSDFPTITTGYTWSLSDNSYATVDSSTGVVTVASLPTSATNITLTCSVTYNNVTKTASTTITLQAPSAPTAISASDMGITLGVDEDIAYTLTGTDPVYDNVQATSSNTGIFTVSSSPVSGGTVTLHPVAAGSATLTLNALAQNGNTAATTSVTITVGESGLYVVVNRKQYFSRNGDDSESPYNSTSNQTPYYLYATSNSDESVLRVNYNFTPDRIWRMNPAAYTTTMQNYSTGFYIRHTEGSEAEGSVKTDNTDDPSATTYRFRFEPYGDYYAIKPYQYISRNQNQNSSFNPYSNNIKAIGLYNYNDDIASQWLYYLVTITETDEVLTDFSVSGTDVLYTTGASDAYTHTNLYLTIPYTTYSFNSGTHNWYDDTDNGESTPSAEEITTGYKWSISSNSYATVNPNTGVITVNSLPTSGDVEVTLTCAMTYNTYSKTAAKTVTIATARNATGISASDMELTMGTDADITYTLTTTDPYGAYDLVYATSSDESIFTVSGDAISGGTVTLHPVAPGQATLTLVAKQTDGTTDACSTTVNIIVGDKASTPTITYVLGETNTTLSITCATQGASIYYTTDGSDPTTGSTLYSAPFTIATSSLPKTVRAIAVKTYYLNSEVAEQLVNYGSGTAPDPYIISSVSDLERLSTYPSAYFKVANDFDASSYEGNTTTFTGQLDGGYYVISDLTHPLFNRATGATIKNMALDNVSLSGTVTVSGTACLGALVAYADGDTKIYNCGILATTGSSINGGNNTGSLVGYLAGNARVVNNYSYANVIGSSYVGGIVGRVAGNALANNNYTDNNHCAVTNNMFYGDLSGTSNVSPVYGGNHTSNVQNTNEYNYWRSRATVSYNNYNNQLAIDKDSYLNRFPFYRHIQNTHRELAAIYLFGSLSDANVAEIGHWYNVKNDETIPYPIIEKWLTNTKRTTVDIAANLPGTTEKFAGKLLSSISSDGYYTGSGDLVTSMGNAGYLTVNISINGSSYTSQLPITDMDTLNYDFTWGKVVLPFANEYDGWIRDYSKVVTGWKITGVTGGTTGTLEDYNYADRDCTAKDIYNATTNNYIFAQGGNYIVPYGVTEINIEANFATAYYLSDAYYDYGYNASYGGATGLTTTVPTTYHGQTVYTNLNTLLSAMSSGVTTPHTQAIVLVGNFHYNQNALGGNILGNYTTKGLTIMSVDEDCNQEPDYGWYSYHTTDRTDVPPMRFDFVPNIGIGMAARTTSSTAMPTIGIWHSHGWFELTETCVSIMSECEINSFSFNATDNGYGNNRWIANSGYFIQIVRARDGNCNRLSYIQIGGNAYVEQLYPGSHTDNARNVTLCPILVTGGEVEDCYMTGYKAGATASGNNIYFWSAGGRIHKYLSAYMENPSTSGVSVTAKVDHARIYRFFGGGTSASARITGNINITMNNSLVDFYCGGPEFGDMASGKTVTTNAIGSTFGQYYGAGFGGTSITYNREGNNGSVSFNSNTVTYPLGWGNYKRLTYNSSYGIGSCYDFEFILYSGGGGTGVARFYTGYAQFSLAQTGNVTNTLQYCTVNGDFYGAGCQGTVDGTVSSTLTGCTLIKNAFGGGYKAAANEVKVYPTTQPTYSVYTRETGLFSDFATIEPETYTWAQGTAGASDATNKILYTTTDMTQLGNVTGAISITVNGGTVGASVFGGGNESPSRNNTTVTVTNGVVVSQDIYGGGNKAVVDKQTTVSVENGSIKGSVFGGGNAAGVGTTSGVSVTGGNITGGVYGGCNSSGTIGGNALVSITGGTVGADAAHANIHGGGYGPQTAISGDVTVNIGSVTGSGNLAVYSGSAIIYGDVYGGSALGTVNTDHSGGGAYNKTSVNLYGGTIDGNVYGGGLGSADIAALVYGDVDVFQYGVVLKARYSEGLPSSGMIFGCNNINGTPKGHVRVGVYKTVGMDGQQRSSAANRATEYENNHSYELAAVYGGGNKAAYVPDDLTNGSTEVFVDGCDDISIHSVYGGGNAASTPATNVTVQGAYEIEYVFGGGNGAGTGNPGANVGYYAYPDNVSGADQISDREGYKYGTGKALTQIYGGRLHKVFGGSNTRGNIREATVAMLDETSDCPLELDGIYGGGKSAYMEGNAEIELGCVSGLNEIYGGAEQADVGKDIMLTITSGKYNKVYGGNNLGGKIMGSITVNIEQTGCLPIEIGELYLGGHNAPYSVYGYNDDGTIKTDGTKVYEDPVMNLRSFKSISTVFGGGEGAGATMAGNPTINVNVVTGWVDGQYKGTGEQDAYSSYHATPQTLTPDGQINTIFGGGNAAKVIGNTTINIGNQATVEMQSLKAIKTKIEASQEQELVLGGIKFTLTDDKESINYTVVGETDPALTRTIIQTVNGATISGNVYGGGNEADVTGSADVKIGE